MGCDVILTSGSFDDVDLKEVLGRLLWGYPHLINIVFSEYSDVRRRNIAQRWTSQNVGEALSEPSAELWAHAKTWDVSSEYMTQGSGWYALFNPGLKRSLDVSLVHSLKHHKCVSFTVSTVSINKILFLRII